MAGHYPTIDLLIPGLDRGKPGRSRDRLMRSACTADPRLVEQRRVMVRELAVRVGGLDVLRALYDQRFDVAALHRAYLEGPAALAALAAASRHKPLREAIDGFISRCRARTASKYKMELDRLAECLGEHATIADVTTEAVQRFLSGLVNMRGKSRHAVSNATRNRYRAAISALCSDAIRMGDLKEHPLAWRQLLPYDEGHRRLPDLSPTEYARYLDRLPDFEHRVFAKVLMHCGADVSEVCALRADECLLDRELPRLRFKRTKVRRSIERLVPVPDHLADDLRRLIKERAVVGRALVFGLSQRGIRSWHDRGRDAIERPDLRMKDFRHIAAIYWRKAGVDLERIRDWLGLTNMQQVQIYAAFGPDDAFDGPKVARATQLLTVAK